MHPKYATQKAEKKTRTLFRVPLMKPIAMLKGEKVTETQWHNLIAWGKVAAGKTVLQKNQAARGG